LTSSTRALRLVDGRQHGARPDPGGMDDPVQDRRDVADRLLRGGQVGEVDRERGAARPVRRGDGRGRVDVRAHHVGATLCKRIGGRSADPAARAGHEDPPPLHHTVHARLLPLAGQW
jgi:hypothetical protein